MDEEGDEAERRDEEEGRRLEVEVVVVSFIFLFFKSSVPEFAWSARKAEVEAEDEGKEKRDEGDDIGESVITSTKPLM